MGILNQLSKSGDKNGIGKATAEFYESNKRMVSIQIILIYSYRFMELCGQDF